jgi:glutamyl-tRNA reductase
MTRLLMIGVSHRTAPVALREKLALTSKQATRFGQELIGHDSIHEAVVLSTCNRTEIYAAVTPGDTRAQLTELAALLAHHAVVDGGDLAKAAYTRAGADVERHLYSVTAGLASMVLGESEIQGQVKRALEAALAAGTTGPLTSRLFSTALKAGKRVRSETAIGASRTSIASIAVDLAVKSVGALDQRAVMLIGTGETGELTAQALAARGSRTVFIANRRIEHAHELAERFSGSVAPLSDLQRQVEMADVIVSATASPHTVIEAPDLRAIMKRRESRPLVLIDLALPREIAPDCREIRGVSMHDLDDLQRVVDATFVARDGERNAAEIIVGEEVDRFEFWLSSRRHRSTTGGELLELFGGRGQDDDSKPRRSSSA